MISSGFSLGLLIDFLFMFFASLPQPFAHFSHPSYLPYFWNSQSLLSNGQTWRVLSQREMQWKWNAWLQTPHAAVHSSPVAVAWFAWHSIHKSIRWLRHMAQVSFWISHAHKAKPFHFFTSKFFFLPAELLFAADALGLIRAGASGISMSLMVFYEKCVVWRIGWWWRWLLRRVVNLPKSWMFLMIARRRRVRSTPW